eukprot:gene844-978_t
MGRGVSGCATCDGFFYRDFSPVAVLDWEMAAIGPRELDLSWIVFAHRVFESITGMLELPGMPHFLREEDIVATYEQASGTTVGDLTWYHVYNAVQWCIVFMRTGARSIHFGEIERPDDIETLMHHKPLMESILDGLPLPVTWAGSSDRNFYDRCYFNAHDRTGDIFVITGAGFYPNLGTKDAFVLVRRGDEQTAVHLSDAIDPHGNDRLDQHVGAYRIE